MYILITYITNHFSLLHKHWKRSSETINGGAFFGTDKTLDADLGGIVQIINWESKEIIKEKLIPTPAGFDLTPEDICMAISGSNISMLDMTLKKKDNNSSLI